jgi:hypothetical protein
MTAGEQTKKKFWTRNNQTRARISQAKARRKAVRAIVGGIQKRRKGVGRSEVYAASSPIASPSSQISAMKL